MAITYEPLHKRQADAWQKEYVASGLKALIQELQSRLDRLESASSPSKTDGLPSKPSDSPSIPPKRKCGRPRIPESVKAQRKLDKQKLFQEMIAKPEIVELTKAVNRMAGGRQAAQSDSGNDIIADASEKRAYGHPAHSDFEKKL